MTNPLKYLIQRAEVNLKDKTKFDLILGRIHNVKRKESQKIFLEMRTVMLKIKKQ